MKKLTTLAAAALALAMTGAGALAETTIQLGTTVNEQDSFQVAAEKFAELVEERTNGEYKIEIYPNGTLGGESDMLDSMSTGMLDMGIITSGPFVNFSEAMGVLDMPYLFANNEEAYKVFDGEIGRELLDSLEDMFRIKKKSSKEVRGHGSFLSLYCVFDQRTVPFLRDAFYRKANGRRKFR